MCFNQSTAAADHNTHICSARQPLDWHRLDVFVSCLVITAFSCRAPSNRICLHMISSHMMTWDMFGPCRQHCPCCPEKNCVLVAAFPTFVFRCSYGKTTKINVDALGLHFSKKLVQQKQCKVSTGHNLGPKLQDSFPASCSAVCRGAESAQRWLFDYSANKKVAIGKVLGVATVSWSA